MAALDAAPHLALDAGGTSTIIQGKLEEPDHSSSNWYFPREEIERNSPSGVDGIDSKKETYFRKSYCTFLQDLGMRLKVPQVTIATAITFCHRFFLRQSHARNDRFMIATVCMFLAGKVEETPRPLRDVILVSYEIRNKKDPAAAQRIKQKDVYEAQKELVLYGERLVLTTLGFDLNVHHPYKPLVAAIKKFKVAQHALAQVAWNFVNDGLRTSLCLQFKPHHIAAGAIFLAAKFLKVKLPVDGEKLWWQEFDVTPRQLEEVSNQMLELYEQNKLAPPSRSDPQPPQLQPQQQPQQQQQQQQVEEIKKYERNGDSAVVANGHAGNEGSRRASSAAAAADNNNNNNTSSSGEWCQQQRKESNQQQQQQQQSGSGGSGNGNGKKRLASEREDEKGAEESGGSEADERDRSRWPPPLLQPPPSSSSSSAAAAAAAAAGEMKKKETTTTSADGKKWTSRSSYERGSGRTESSGGEDGELNGGGGGGGGGYRHHEYQREKERESTERERERERERGERERERGRGKEREWQERDTKKVRYDRDRGK